MAPVVYYIGTVSYRIAVDVTGVVTVDSPAGFEKGSAPHRHPAANVGGIAGDGLYQKAHYFSGIDKFAITVYFNLHFTYNGTKSGKP